MYHGIVRRRALALFEAVNRGNAEPVLEMFASEFEHVFIGDTLGEELAGTYQAIPQSVTPSSRSLVERVARIVP